MLWPLLALLQSLDAQQAASLAPCSNGGNIVLALQSSALALGELQTLTEWQFGRTFYTLPGYRHSNEANRIITELVAARLFPGGRPLQMDPSVVVEGLCSDGWIGFPPAAACVCRTMACKSLQLGEHVASPAYVLFHDSCHFKIFQIGN